MLGLALVRRCCDGYVDPEVCVQFVISQTAPNVGYSKRRMESKLVEVDVKLVLSRRMSCSVP